MTFDWKFFVIVLITIFGVVVPVWLWQVDLSALSLSLRLASSVALQPAGTTSIPNLQVSIDGVKIESPFLSTLELSNDGSKPIPTSDFESPIELSVGQDTQVVRARISSSEPNYMKAELDTNRQSVKLRPLLLNPKDRLTIAIITSGSAPAFVVRSRIAGISNIKFEDETTKKPDWFYAAQMMAMSLLGLVLYFFYGASFIRPSILHYGWKLKMITVLCLGLLSPLALRRSYEALGLEIFPYVGWFFVTYLLIGFSVVIYIIRREER